MSDEIQKEETENNDRTNLEPTKDLNYWKKSAEEDYLHTPMSVLKYITLLEKELNLYIIEDELDIIKCKYCGSTDIIGCNPNWWCSDCGKTHL